MGKEECKKCEYCKAYDDLLRARIDNYPVMFFDGGKAYACADKGVAYLKASPYGDYTCDKYKPKSQNKTCPTCKHGRISNIGHFAFNGVPYQCVSPRSFILHHGEDGVTCDRWEEKAKSPLTKITIIKNISNSAGIMQVMETTESIDVTEIDSRSCMIQESVGMNKFFVGMTDHPHKSASWQEIPKYLYDALIRFEGENDAE